MFATCFPSEVAVVIMEESQTPRCPALPAYVVRTASMKTGCRDGSAGDGRWRCSNGSRVRWWKVALQRLANETGLRITVGHFRRDEQVEQNRASHVQPYPHELARKTFGLPRNHVNLIASTTTQTRLKIEAEMDHNLYPKVFGSWMRNSKNQHAKSRLPR